MKTKCLFFIISGLFFVHCSNNQHETSHKKDVSQAIVDFLKWYKINSNKLSQIPLINADSFYTVDFNNTNKYIATLKQSGFVSDAYTNSLNKYFKQCNENFIKHKQYEGPPMGLDCDLFMLSQDYEEDLNKIDKIKFSINEISKDQASVIARFYYGNKLTYHLSRLNNNWLIDKIESK